MQKISVLIPIKKRSQRVPNKNYRSFGGMPLWEHTVKKFNFCPDIDLYIDTDDPELIVILRKKYPRITAYARSKELCGHDVSVTRLIANWVKKCDPLGFLFQIHVTSPFIEPELLYQAYSQMEAHHDSIFAVRPYQNRFWYSGGPINHDPSCLKQTQELEPVYEDCSLFYGFSKNVALKIQRIGASPCMYEIDNPQITHDIDTEKDWADAIAFLALIPPAENSGIRSNSYQDELANIGIDFDGVIHECTKGFYDGTIYDPPVDGSIEAIKTLSKKYNIIIYTCKAKPDRPLVSGTTGASLVWQWLDKHGISEYVHSVTAEKPRAVAYIDDKAIEFHSWKKCLETLKSREL